MAKIAKILRILRIFRDIHCTNCQKTFEVSGTACPSCDGTGENGHPFSENNCKRCKGYGIIIKDEDKICPDCKKYATKCPKCGHYFDVSILQKIKQKLSSILHL